MNRSADFQIGTGQSCPGHADLEIGAPGFMAGEPGREAKGASHQPERRSPNRHDPV